jgi:hypothetical protein
MNEAQGDLFDFGGELRAVYVVAFGRGITLAAEGTHGKITLRCEPVDRYLHLVSGGDPCATCEHRERCEDIVGCPCAEAWHRARLDYAEATRRKNDRR